MKVHENLTAKVKKMFKQKENLRAKDKKLLDRPMEEVLAMTQSNMRAYFDQVGNMDNIATREAIEYERTTTRNIRAMLETHT